MRLLSVDYRPYFKPYQFTCKYIQTPVYSWIAWLYVRTHYLMHANNTSIQQNLLLTIEAWSEIKYMGVLSSIGMEQIIVESTWIAKVILLYMSCNAIVIYVLYLFQFWYSFSKESLQKFIEALQWYYLGEENELIMIEWFEVKILH